MPSIQNKPLVVRPAPLTGGNAINATFTDRVALRNVLRDLKAAKHKIQFESFLFNGADGEAIAKVLIAQHQAGVKVQVLLDEKGAKLDKERLVKMLRDAGVEVRYYNTKGLDHGFMAVDHAKIVSVDDRIAWAGGVNFDREVNRDMMTRMRGPAVSKLQDTFEAGWKQAGGTVLPRVPAPYRKPGDTWIGVAQTAPGEKTTRAQVLGELRTLGAGDRLDLSMMDLGDIEVVDGLVKAHERGAQLRVLLDPHVPFVGGRPTDKIVERLGAGLPDLGAIDTLQKAGVEVRYYQAPEGINKLHTKVWNIVRKAGTPEETRTVIGGSVNALKGAYDFNHEVGVLMKGQTISQRFARAFEADWAHNAQAIGKLGFWARFKAAFIRALNKHLV